MIAVENFGEAVAVSAGGEPPALLTSTSRRPKRSIGRADDRVDLVGIADVGGDERRPRALRRGQRLGLVAAADRRRRHRQRGSARRCRGRRPGIRPSRSRPCRVKSSGSSSAMAATVPDGSVRVRRVRAAQRDARARAMIRSEVRDHVAEVIIDNPPVNALPVAGWFELADTIRRLGRDPDVRVLIVAANPELRAFQVGVDIKELAADPTKQSLIGVNRGLLGDVRRGLRLRGPGDRGRPRVLPRRRRRDRRQRRHRRRGRRPAARRPRGRPWRARRRHAPVAARARCTRCGRCSSRARWSRRSELLAFGSVERVVPRAELMDAAREIAADDRREEPARDPRAPRSR